MIFIENCGYLDCVMKKDSKNKASKIFKNALNKFVKTIENPIQIKGFESVKKSISKNSINDKESASKESIKESKSNVSKDSLKEKSVKERYYKNRTNLRSYCLSSLIKSDEITSLTVYDQSKLIKLKERFEREGYMKAEKGNIKEWYSVFDNSYSKQKPSFVWIANQNLLHAFVKIICDEIKLVESYEKDKWHIACNIFKIKKRNKTATLITPKNLLNSRCNNRVLYSKLQRVISELFEVPK